MLISCFLSQRKFRVSVEREICMPREAQASVRQGADLSPTLYSIYINDTPRTPDVYLGLFAGDTCVKASDHKEGYVLRKRQWGLSAIEKWWERFNIETNEDETQAIYFLIDLGPLRLILHWIDGISPLSLM
jgi:hypothetical protein